MRFWMMVAAVAGAIYLFPGLPASARSPVPYFKGVETLALFCGRPSDRTLRMQLCAAARDALVDLTGSDIEIGPQGFSDPRTITVLVNGYETEGPNGPVLAITIDMLRKGHVDSRLFGSPPVLLAPNDLVTKSRETAEKLKAELAETVVGPWRLALPVKKDG